MIAQLDHAVEHQQCLLQARGPRSITWLHAYLHTWGDGICVYICIYIYICMYTLVLYNEQKKASLLFRVEVLHTGPSNDLITKHPKCPVSFYTQGYIQHLRLKALWQPEVRHVTTSRPTSAQRQLESRKHGPREGYQHRNSQLPSHI